MLILEIYGRVCRVCMCESSNLHDLNDTTEGRLTINEMLTKTVSGIQANIEFPVPQEICDLCMEHLQISFRFQQLCLNTNEKMFTIWEQSQKAELKQTEGYIKFLGQTEDDKPDPIKVEYHVEIDKLEGEEEKTENVDVLEGYDKLDNVNELTRHRRSAIKNYNESEEEDVPLSALNKKKSENPKDEKEDGEARFGANMTKNAATPTNAKPHVCDICGKSLSRAFSLRRHKLVHSEERRKFTKNRCGNDEDDIKTKTPTKSNKSKTNKSKKNIEYIHDGVEGDEMEMDNDVNNFDSTQDDTDSDNCRSDMIKHAATHTNAKPHVCDICGSRFTRAYSLRRHKLVHSEERRKFTKNRCGNDEDDSHLSKCDISDKSFTTPNMSQKHLSGKHKDIAKTSKIKTKTLTKSHKSKTNKSKKNIDNDGGEGDEMEMDNDVNNSDSTEDDSDSDNCRSDMTKHAATHTNAKPHVCDICGNSFSIVYSLRRHMLVHLEERLFKCDQCSMTFKDIYHLRRHMRTHGEKPYKCKYCERAYSARLDLSKHLKTHKSPYLCPQCGNIFQSANTLHQHMARHKGLKKYQCPECPSRFNCSSDVIKHASTHSNAKPHVCDLCGSRFTRNTSLRKHKKLHSEERPFKCDQCSMTFKCIYRLQRHMRTHTGEKPHKCKYCERAYAASGDLTKHLRTHVGKNTYICDQCPMAFKYQIELKQHQSEHYKMAQKLLPTIIEQKEPHSVMDDTARQDNNIDIKNLT